MLDADAVINNSSQKVGGSNAYPDPAPKRWVGPDPEKHIGSTPLQWSASSVGSQRDAARMSASDSFSQFLALYKFVCVHVHASAAERRAQATADGCRCCRKRLLSVGVSCPADRSAANPPAAVTATVCRSMGQTDRRTTDRYIHPALSIEEDRTKVRKFVVWMYGFWDMWAGTWTDIHTVIIMIAWWHSNALHSLYFFIFYKKLFLNFTTTFTMSFRKTNIFLRPIFKLFR